MQNVFASHVNGGWAKHGRKERHFLNTSSSPRVYLTSDSGSLPARGKTEKRLQMSGVSHLVTVQLVHSQPASPNLGFVENVVVDQRGHVDHLCDLSQLFGTTHA